MQGSRIVTHWLKGIARDGGHNAVRGVRGASSQNQQDSARSCPQKLPCWWGCSVHRALCRCQAAGTGREGWKELGHGFVNES